MIIDGTKIDLSFFCRFLLRRSRRSRSRRMGSNGSIMRGRRQILIVADDVASAAYASSAACIAIVDLVGFGMKR